MRAYFDTSWLGRVGHQTDLWYQRIPYVRQIQRIALVNRRPNWWDWPKVLPASITNPKLRRLSVVQPEWRFQTGRPELLQRQRCVEVGKINCLRILEDGLFIHLAKGATVTESFVSYYCTQLRQMVKITCGTRETNRNHILSESESSNYCDDKHEEHTVYFYEGMRQWV